jgi:NAD(P) transhydrogenase subunit alpha
MPIRVAIPTERLPGENRVAMVPAVAARLAGMGAEVHVEEGAGKGCHLPDEAYEQCTIDSSRAQLYKSADVILKVQPPDDQEITWIKEGAVVIGMLAAAQHPEMTRALRDSKVTSFSMELIPRISRAQAMDTLSSQASIAGYKAVLMAAVRSGRFFPMLTTAAGTIRPARVLVMGAGVAGLQAIATARRLGAIVEGYDIRKVTKEQVESLGARFVELGVDAEADGGYARELTDEEKKQQAEALAKHICGADVVITTAAIPGRTAPRLIDKATVERMKPGAVVVDLAAETGGNCEVTEAGKDVVHSNVTVYGPVNIASQMAFDASEMYSKNLLSFLTLMVKDGELNLDWDDEIIAQSALTHEGRIASDWVRQQIEGEQA